MKIKLLVKEIRLEKDLSMRDLEKISTVPRSTLSLIENYNIDIKVSTLCKIAKALHVTLDELVKY